MSLVGVRRKNDRRDIIITPRRHPLEEPSQRLAVRVAAERAERLEGLRVVRVSRGRRLLLLLSGVVEMDLWRERPPPRGRASRRLPKVVLDDGG